MSKTELSRMKQPLVPLATLIGRELRNGKTEKPFVKYGQAGLAKKGEDYFLIKTDCHRVPGDSSTSFSVFAILDGHNGISAAIFAKENIINNVMSAIPQGVSREEWLQALPRALVVAFVKTDMEFQKKGETSGTTATFVIIDGWTVTVASVGDSRCILDTQGGVVSLLTVDHRLEENVEERERVTASGGEVGRLNVFGGNEVGPLRCWPGGLCLSRSIGDTDVGEYIVPIPHVKQVKLNQPCSPDLTPLVSTQKTKMAVMSVHQFAQCITCHAWSPDQSMVAFCPNNNEVHIYRLVEDKWEKVHVLQKHDQVISGIDWSARSNRIVTSSHDRNSYVWNLEGSEWVPTLVILRLNRAALCVQWSPKENKFAVGSGAKTVCICYYEQENNWWVSKLIRKRHDSSVTSVSWHPDNILLATTSTDGKCRVFSTFIKGVDAKDSKKSTSDMKFGELIVQLDLSSSWTFGVKWSPSGNTLAYVGHNSMIYFVDDVGPSPLAQNVVFRDLPLRDVLFVSERTVIGVGYDCNPMVFAADERGVWGFVRYLGERKTVSSGSRYGSQFSEAFGKFYGQSKYGVGNDAVETSKTRGSVHDNCINSIIPLGEHGTLTRRFSTSGLDGRIAVWDLENEQDLLEL